MIIYAKRCYLSSFFSDADVQFAKLRYKATKASRANRAIQGNKATGLRKGKGAIKGLCLGSPSALLALYPCCPDSLVCLVCLSIALDVTRESEL